MSRPAKTLLLSLRASGAPASSTLRIVSMLELSPVHPWVPLWMAAVISDVDLIRDMPPIAEKLNAVRRATGLRFSYHVFDARARVWALPGLHLILRLLREWQFYRWTLERLAIESNDYILEPNCWMASGRWWWQHLYDPLPELSQVQS